MGAIMERQFKGIWIPAHIWLRMDLTAIDKVLLADIDSFTGNGKLFYKSNATLTKELGVSESTVKRSVKTLSTLRLVELSGNTRKRLIRSLVNPDDSGHIGGNSVQDGSDKVQDEPTLGSNSTPTNSSISSIINPLPDLPVNWDNNTFRGTWGMWLDERKERRYGRYTPRGEKAAIHKLFIESEENQDIAIQMINESIANGWRGIFPLKNQKNERNSTKDFSSDEYSDYLKAIDDGTNS
jgi:hypothetical protein|tara:strand:+ start:2208 stop:2924 length:717 start_codon:yes stop_codon:yes gene_type:complete